MRNLITSVLIIIIAGGLIYFLSLNKPQETENLPNEGAGSKLVTYKTSEYSPQFTYPKKWGEVTLKEGNKLCPEEDTYRTQDTLHVFDWEYSFTDKELPGSDSIMRIGIRRYSLDPSKPNNCGDAFLLTLASGEIIPEALSSVMLTSVMSRDGHKGVFNPRASRLDTEARTQYTYFIPGPNSYDIVQPYLSFVPYFGSPELIEIEGRFGNDIDRYIEQGETAGPIREYLNDFKNMVASLEIGTQ